MYLVQERLPFSKAGFCHDTGSFLGDHPNSFDSGPGHVDHRYVKMGMSSFLFLLDSGPVPSHTAIFCEAASVPTLHAHLYYKKLDSIASYQKKFFFWSANLFYFLAVLRIPGSSAFLALGSRIQDGKNQGFGSGSLSGFAWIRINLSCWIRIRIRIQIADPDPGGKK